MERKKISIVMGTRPEAIKLGPVVRCLKRDHERFETHVIATAQHRQMLDQVLDLFGIEPDIDLNLMRRNQDLSHLTSRALSVLSPALDEAKPDLLVVQGDTTTVFTAALAAFYLKIPVAHVEAGLRSHDIENPFPEEVYRRLTSTLTSIHFAPTALACQELMHEGVTRDKIVITGNTVVDALSNYLDGLSSLNESCLVNIPFNNHRIIVVTAHRRESWGEGLENICFALRDLVKRFPDVVVVFPVHMNPTVRQTVKTLLDDIERIYLIEPLDYLTFNHLLQKAHLILTDSGGIQEEAPALHKPVLVLRQVTERPEASQAGLAKIVGTSTDNIIGETTKLLNSTEAYNAMTSGVNPYGDGQSAERIVEAISRWSRGQYPLLEPTREFGRSREHEHALRSKGSHSPRRVGEVLMDEGLITARQLGEALAKQHRSNGCRLGTIIKEMGILQSDELERALSSKQFLDVA